jgi:hypothetical protein
VKENSHNSQQSSHSCISIVVDLKIMKRCDYIGTEEDLKTIKFIEKHGAFNL